MRNKKKWLTAILGGICCACICFAVGLGIRETTAYAAANETPKYTFEFDYTRKTTNGSSTSTTTGTATSVSVQTAAYSSFTASLNIYGSSSYTTGSLAKGGYINSSTVNLAIESSSAMGNLTVYNASGTQVGKGNKTLKLTGLADGKYSVEIYFGGGAWATSSRSGIGVNVSGTTSFVVDSTPPTITGASTSMTGQYRNSLFTVTASDNMELDKLYYMRSGGSKYLESGSSFKSNAATSNSVYCFYAVDKAGNQSATHYVRYDTILPVGAVRYSSGSEVTGKYTNKAFQYWATDSGSDIDLYEYKTPGSTSWKSYTGSTLIQPTAANGLYRFRARDKAGNYSVESTITLDATNPKGTFSANGKTIDSGGSTNVSDFVFNVSDVGSGIKRKYVKYPDKTVFTEIYNETQFVAEGEYSFYCEDLAGNVSDTYTITLDKTAPKLVCKETAFNSTYGTAFTVKVADSGDTLMYKKPTDSSYSKVAGESITIRDGGGNGKYYFYAQDAAGNTSAIYWIDLEVVIPTAQIIRGSDNTVCVVWTDSSYTAKLNGNIIASGTRIKTEGTYALIVTNKYNQTNSYGFTINHNYEIVKSVGSTCTGVGYTIKRCTLCGDEKTENFTEALGHDYKTTVHAPTCTERGYTEYACSRCDSYYISDYIPELGHSYEKTVVAATCTEEGCTKYTCARCGDSYSENSVSAFGHRYIEKELAPTCTENGCLLHTCTVCGFEYRSDEKEATGHNYDTKVETMPTCLKDGIRRHRCDKCGEEYDTVIPATGHNYQLIHEETTDGITTRTYRCSECGEEVVENIGNNYEKVSNYVEYLFKQYSPYMWWVLLSTTGVWSLAIGIAIIIAQKNEEKEKARKMLVNYVIGLAVIFAIVVACPYLVRGIAILVT